MYKILKYLLFLPYLLLGTASLLSAQERIGAFPDLEWYKALAGSNYYDQFKDMEQGPDGSIYYAGTYTNNLYVGILGNADTLFQDSIQHDPQTAHAYLVKLDSNGVFQWVWIVKGGAEAASSVTDIVLDSNGGVWVAAKYQGAVDIPFGGQFVAPGTHGFVLHLNANGVGSEFLHITGASVVPRKLFINPQGQREIVLQSLVYPIVVGSDTLQVDTSANPFLTLVRLDSSSDVIDAHYLATIGSSRAGYGQSTMDQQGNIFFELWLYGNSIAIPGDMILGSNTITLFGDNLVKMNPNFQLEWIRPLRHIANNYNIGLEEKDGNVILAADSYDAKGSFVECFSEPGDQQWTISTSGYWATTGGIATAGNYLYWSGYYQCDMSIDTCHFKIGEQRPWPYGARTGFLAVVNRHSGKLAWVMSDETTNQDKRFGRIVANGDDNITVETRVITTLCTIDTLTLQLTSVDVPYHMLLRFHGKQFPPWPVVPDPIPSFSLWPNPTQGAFTVQVDQSWGPKTRLEVYNLAGQKLWTQSIQAQEVFLEMENASGQLLLIRIVDDGSGRRMTKKLVVLH